MSERILLFGVNCSIQSFSYATCMPPMPTKQINHLPSAAYKEYVECDARSVNRWNGYTHLLSEAFALFRTDANARPCILSSELSRPEGGGC